MAVQREWRRLSRGLESSPDSECHLLHVALRQGHDSHEVHANRTEWISATVSMEVRCLFANH